MNPAPLRLFTGFVVAMDEAYRGMKLRRFGSASEPHRSCRDRLSGEALLRLKSVSADFLQRFNDAASGTEVP